MSLRMYVCKANKCPSSKSDGAAAAAAGDIVIVTCLLYLLERGLRRLPSPYLRKHSTNKGTRDMPCLI